VWFPSLHLELKPPKGTSAEAFVQNLTALLICARSILHLARLAFKADPQNCRSPDNVMSRVWGLQVVGSSWELCGVVTIVEVEGDEGEGWRRWLGGDGWEGVSLVSGASVLRGDVFRDRVRVGSLVGP